MTVYVLVGKSVSATVKLPSLIPISFNHFSNIGIILYPCSFVYGFTSQ